MADNIQEMYTRARKAFDEVFGVRGIWRATYPPPLITEGMIQKIHHFYFKDQQVVWAWQERWKDIEYVRELIFVTYEKPKYKYSYEKEEHRYICDEARYSVVYKAPKIEEGVMTEYPSLQLKRLGDQYPPGPPRFFKIEYDNNVGYIEWMDEGSGNVDGSVGVGDEQNIYEVTSPTPADSKWNHDENCLFDHEAVRSYTEAKDAGREFRFIGIDGEIESNYYNRGIIVKILISMLDFLPYEEVNYAQPIGTVDKPQAISTFPAGVTYRVWYNTSPTIAYSIVYEEAVHIGAVPISCIYKVVIKGKWGIIESTIDGITAKYSVCLPGVEVTGVSEGTPNLLATKTGVPFDETVHGNIGIRDFEFEMFLQPISFDRFF